MRIGAALFILLLAWSSQASDRDAVFGHWASSGSIFEIYEKDGQLYGQIRALREPFYNEGEREGYAGKPREDHVNPDPAMRSRPMIGVHMFTEFRYEDGLWRGKIYDPESGNTYKSHIKLNKDLDLEIRGYIGVPMLGRTATFKPISSCKPVIVEMLKSLPEVAAC